MWIGLVSDLDLMLVSGRPVMRVMFHFRSADEEARRLGERVSHWTFQKFLKPTTGKKKLRITIGPGRQVGCARVQPVSRTIFLP